MSTKIEEYNEPPCTHYPISTIITSWLQLFHPQPHPRLPPAARPGNRTLFMSRFQWSGLTDFHGFGTGLGKLLAKGPVSGPDRVAQLTGGHPAK